MTIWPERGEEICGLKHPALAVISIAGTAFEEALVKAQCSVIVVLTGPAVTWSSNHREVTVLV